MTRFLKLALAGASCVAAALSAMPTMAQAETLTISWWGYNGEKMDANIIQPFKKMCGCDVVFETGNNADRLNKLKARGGSGVDVIYLTDSYSQLGIEDGLFQKLDRSKIPNVKGLYEIAQAPQGDYGPAYTIGRIGMVYDSAKVKEPITSWNDMWRDDLKGSVSLPGITTTAGPMMVVLAGKHAGVDAYADPDAACASVQPCARTRVSSWWSALTTSGAAVPCTASRARSSTTWSWASRRASARSSRSWASGTVPPLPARTASTWRSASATPCTWRPPTASPSRSRPLRRSR